MVLQGPSEYMWGGLPPGFWGRGAGQVATPAVWETAQQHRMGEWNGGSHLRAVAWSSLPPLNTMHAVMGQAGGKEIE